MPEKYDPAAAFNAIMLRALGRRDSEEISIAEQIGLFDSEPILFIDDVQTVDAFPKDGAIQKLAASWGVLGNKKYHTMAVAAKASDLASAKIWIRLCAELPRFLKAFTTPKDLDKFSDAILDNWKKVTAEHERYIIDPDSPSGFIRWYQVEEYGVLLRFLRKNGEVRYSGRLTMSLEYTNALFDAYFKRLQELEK